MDSIEQPATAPPIVIVLSSETSAGTRLYLSVASTSFSNVTPGSAIQIKFSLSMCIISSKSLISSFSSVCFLSLVFGTVWDTVFFFRLKCVVSVRSFNCFTILFTFSSWEFIIQSSPLVIVHPLNNPLF